jgi:predicted transcriptional regulator
MSTTSTIPAAELIHRLPPPDEIRRRIDEIAAERKALMTLLRSAIAAERRRQNLVAGRREVQQ